MGVPVTLANDQLRPCELTGEEFANGAQALLGRGYQQACELYREIMRTGAAGGSHAAFNNCPQLKQELINCICLPSVHVAQTIKDGSTEKAILELPDGLRVEMVLIAMRSGGTLCISTQVGCARGCAFCETGRMGLLRNLTVEEIVAQLWLARTQLGWSVRNVVFMGMGEPLDNLDNLKQALAIMCDAKGLEVGPGRITVSTVGHVPGMWHLLESAPRSLKLALSLHAPNDELRNRLMPVNRQWNLADLRVVLEAYSRQQRCVLIEYILIAGMTDTREIAQELAEYLSGLNVRVNCIPYNPQSNPRFSAPSEEQQRLFIGELRQHGLPVLLRHHRGRDSMAACGQLGDVPLARALRRPVGS